MLSGNILPWITTISFLIYTPVLSYLDWKYRDIKSHKIWLPLIAINIPVLIAGYFSEFYPMELAGISIISMILWFALMRLNILPSADYVFLSLISLFMILNPITGLPFMLMFSFFLVGFTAATFWWIFLDNFFRRHKFSLEIENGLPYLIPISCALIAALVIGVPFCQ
ncbi:MAG: hypothetical protein WC626_05425 [Methanoregula sp.]